MPVDPLRTARVASVPESQVEARRRSCCRGWRTGSCTPSLVWQASRASERQEGPSRVGAAWKGRWGRAKAARRGLRRETRHRRRPGRLRPWSSSGEPGHGQTGWRQRESGRRKDGRRQHGGLKSKPRERFDAGKNALMIGVGGRREGKGDKNTGLRPGFHADGRGKAWSGRAGHQPRWAPERTKCARGTG